MKWRLTLQVASFMRRILAFHAVQGKARGALCANYAEKDVPQPQDDAAFGLSILK